MSNIFDRVAGRIAKTTYVILLKDDKGNLTLLADPGMGKPWCANGPNPIANKKLADYHASECDGMACTFEEAWKLLMKANPKFEKNLYDRVEAVTKQMKEDLSALKKQKNAILDEHGRPTN